jgi:hypothetical protein
MRIGITGHQRLKNPSSWDWVEGEIKTIVALFPEPLIGITSLAIGADQLFAKIILEQQGTIEAIIPFEGYKLKFAEGNDRQEYQNFLNRASRIEVLQKKTSDEEAYFAAGKRVVDLAEILIAVWDGKPAVGLGGTADVVTYATQKRKKIRLMCNQYALTGLQHTSGGSGEA